MDFARNRRIADADRARGAVDHAHRWSRRVTVPERAIWLWTVGVSVIEFGRADTDAERTEVARFFYSVYVDEMGRFRDDADHERREFRDPEDAYSWLFVARDGGRVIGACRLTWGGDGFSERQIQSYCLAPFLAAIPAEKLVVGERTMVAPEYRGGDVWTKLGISTGPLITAHDVALVFGVSEPHLVPMYAELGQRPYAPRNFWSEESGYLVPSVSIPNDITAARAARRSPEHGVPFDWRAGTELQALPRGVRDLLGSFGAVAAAPLQGDDEYWTEVQGALAQLPTETPGLFDSMTSEAVRACIQRSVILECCRDDHIVKRDGTARNMYVVLDGAFEARERRPRRSSSRAG